MLSIFVKVKTKKVTNVSNQYQKNKLEVAKRLCNGEAQVVPFFDTNTLVLCHLIHPILMFEIFVNMTFQLL